MGVLVTGVAPGPGFATGSCGCGCECHMGVEPRERDFWRKALTGEGTCLLKLQQFESYNPPDTCPLLRPAH